MKNLLRIFLAVVLVVVAYAKPSMTSWREGENKSTHEKYIGLTIIDGGALGDLPIKGLNTRKWTYLVTLKGERRTRYEKDQISLFSPDSMKPNGKPVPQIESGYVDVDFAKGSLLILLRVRTGDRVEDFEGNATYSIIKKRA